MTLSRPTLLGAAVAALVSVSSGAQAARISCHNYGNGLGKMAGRGTPNPHGLPIVAHKSLPFGTRVRFANAYGYVDAIVKDRGPYYHGREYDLDCRAMRLLHIDGVGSVRTLILGR